MVNKVGDTSVPDHAHDIVVEGQDQGGSEFFIQGCDSAPNPLSLLRSQDVSQGTGLVRSGLVRFRCVQDEQAFFLSPFPENIHAIIARNL